MEKLHESCRSIDSFVLFEFKLVSSFLTDKKIGNWNSKGGAMLGIISFVSTRKAVYHPFPGR